MTAKAEEERVPEARATTTTPADAAWASRSGASVA
jgi:hypothetical protein